MKLTLNNACFMTLGLLCVCNLAYAEKYDTQQLQYWDQVCYRRHINKEKYDACVDEQKAEFDEEVRKTEEKYRERQARDDAIREQLKLKWAAEEQERKIAQAEVDRRAKLPGVTLGMSKDTVLNKSNWGKPDHINTTMTSYGTREQWVYGGGNYLYFENGKLTAAQSSK